MRAVAGAIQVRVRAGSAPPASCFAASLPLGPPRRRPSARSARSAPSAQDGLDTVPYFVKTNSAVIAGLVA